MSIPPSGMLDLLSEYDANVNGLEGLLDFIALDNQGKLDIQPEHWSVILGRVVNNESKEFYSYVGAIASPLSHVKDPNFIETVIGDELESRAVTVNGKKPYGSLPLATKDNYWARYGSKKGDTRLVSGIMNMAAKARAMWAVSPGVTEILRTSRSKQMDRKRDRGGSTPRSTKDYQ